MINTDVIDAANGNNEDAARAKHRINSEPIPNIIKLLILT
jgi:hypothetical protein